MVDVRVVLVGGSSAGGKTRFKHELVSAMKNVVVIPFSLDCGYKTPDEEAFKDISKYDFDDPDAFDWPLLVQTTQNIISSIQAAKSGDTIDYELPHYDFTTHRRDGYIKKTITILPNSTVIIIIEGIFALYHHDLLKLADVKIFIEADEKTRILRRIIRDLLFRKRDILSIALQTLLFVEPAYETRVKPTRANAYFVIDNNITAQEVKNVMDVLRGMGCQNFVAEEMIKTVMGKEETFVDGCGDKFRESILIIAKFLSI